MLTLKLNFAAFYFKICPSTQFDGFALVGKSFQLKDSAATSSPFSSLLEAPASKTHFTFGEKFTEIPGNFPQISINLPPGEI